MLMLMMLMMDDYEDKRCAALFVRFSGEGVLLTAPLVGPNLRHSSAPKFAIMRF
jgi:hypothetical protein